MRVIALVNAFNEKHLIERCVRSLVPYVNKTIVSDVDWPTGTVVSFDGTHDMVMDLCKEFPKRVKYLPSEKLSNKNPRINEGTRKTHMMYEADPKDGDWIWIVEGDEFYLDHQLKGLKERLLLGHKAITAHDRRWLTVSSLEFAYNTTYCHFGYHGRFFRFKQGSKFTLSNHFLWPDGEISQDKYRWHIPICHLQMFHLKYVKPLERIAKRNQLNTNPKDDEGYSGWFHSVFSVWPKNPERAYANNSGGGWVKNSGLKLFQYKGELPKQIEKLDFDLMEELR